MTERLLLRVEEAAEMLSLGRSKTYALVASGDLPSVRIGKARRIHIDDLRAWIEASRPTQDEHAIATR